jgi:hypothetical protein
MKNAMIYRNQEGDWWLRIGSGEQERLAGPYLTKDAAEDGLRRLTYSPPSWPNRPRRGEG